jgi:hypothetical protein
MALLAQTRGGAEMQETPRAEEPGVEESPTRVFYLEDEDGQLVPVPGFTLQDFDRLLLQERPARVTPTAALREMTLKGQARDSLVDFDVSLSVTTETAGWTPVPLRLPEAVLSKFEVQGPDSWRLESGDEGYILWLRKAEAGTAEHKVRFHVLAEVATSSGGRRVRVALPLATTTQVELGVPLPNAEATVARPGLLEKTLRENGTSVFVIRPGLDGRLDVSWARPTQPSDRPTPVSRATGTIAVRVEGPAVRSDVALTLETLQLPLSTFRVRLPQGAQLVGEATLLQDGTVKAATVEVLPGAQPLMEVRLDMPTPGPLVLNFSTVYLAEEGADEGIDLAGFEVLNAGQQSGQIAIQVAEGWQLALQRRRAVEQIEPDSLVETLRALTPTHAFEYFSQPAMLRARVLRPRTRVTVEPSYTFVVFPEHIELVAHLRYQAPSPGVRQLTIAMLAGWEPDLQSISTTPPGLVDRMAINMAEGGRLTIGLKEPVRGAFELELRASRPLTETLAKLAIGVPSPEVDGLGPATVRIQPADNVRLVPDSEKMVGLNRLPEAPIARSAAIWQQPAMAYRTAVATARFVAAGQVMPREVRLNQSNVDVAIASSVLRVTQVLTYEALHEPIDELLFALPDNFETLSSLEIRVDNKPAPAPERLLLPEGPRMRVRLDGGRLGVFRVAIAQAIPIGDGPPGSSFEGRVTLFRPDWPGPIPSRLVIDAPTGTDVTLHGDAWTPIPGDPYAARRAEDLPTEISMLIESPETTVPTRIARSWIQTWLVSGQRRDRLGLLVEASQGDLRLQLPEGTDGSSVSVSVGGITRKPDLKPSGTRLMLTVSLAKQSMPVSVEVRYGLALPQGMLPSRIDLPQLEDRGRWGMTYWEVLLPGDRHLLETPAGLVAEYSWGWETLAWGRRPVFSPEQLARWVGIEDGPPIPPGVNRYLFSHWGEPTGMSLQTIPRTWLVLASSLAALIVGLALTYLSWLRHRAMLLLLAVALGALGWWQAEIAPLFAQAALLGILLAAVAGLMRTFHLRRRSRGRLVRSSGSSITSRPLTELWQSSSSEDGSTAAATIVRQLPSA